MKHSKQLTDWFRKKCWGVFMQTTPEFRKKVFNNNFEFYCKNLAKSELYINTVNFMKYRPKLKSE